VTNGQTSSLGHAFLQVDHALYRALAVLLCVTGLLALADAAAALWLGLPDWTTSNSVFVVIDRLLVVAMLIEILHTVRVLVRSGSLTCEPFPVVGLTACIRRLLVITLESSQATQHGEVSDSAERMFRMSMIELGVLAVLLPVMVISIYLLRKAEAEAPEAGQNEDGSVAA
jgi:hypothetical protein